MAKQLMYWTDQKRWQKRYKGKLYGVSPRQLDCPPTKEGSRAAANEWWQAKKAEIDSNARKPYREDYEATIKFNAAMRDWASKHGDDEAYELAKARVEDLEKKFASNNPPPLKHWERDPLNRRMHSAKRRVSSRVRFPGDDILTEAEVAIWRDRLAKEKFSHLPMNKTVAGNVASFLSRKEGLVAVDQLSPGRYDSYRCCLEHFKAFIGAGAPVNSLDAKVLLDYHSQLLKEIKDGMAPAYARDHMSTVKQYIRYCWTLQLLELPRNIDRPETTIKVPSNKIVIFEVDEFKRLLNASSDTTKLYLLLMLNCGMQQQDIAELNQEEVDWEQGRIIRKRGKTENHESVPTVNYRLWRETLQLLKAHGSTETDLVLLNRKGEPLKKELIVDGKVQKIDNIRSAYNRVVQKLKIPQQKGKSLKLVRKTGASTLAKHSEYGRFDSHYLGHAPATIAAKHYTLPPQKRFDQAIKWLGQQFGIS